MKTKTSAAKATQATKPTAQDAADKAEADKQTAHAMMSGQCGAAVVQAYLTYVNSGSNLTALDEVARAMGKRVAADDFSDLERMLLSQATALQAMFTDLALRSRRMDLAAHVQMTTALALKCATGSRQAITALAELRMPKSVLFAKQANVTNGPQQVNNGVMTAPPASRTATIQERPNELLEATHGNCLDTRAPSTASRADSVMATVGTIHGASDGSR
jgi:hypothetical protein